MSFYSNVSTFVLERVLYPVKGAVASEVLSRELYTAYTYISYIDRLSQTIYRNSDIITLRKKTGG